MVFTEIIVLLMPNMQTGDFYGMIHYTGAAGVWMLRSWWGTADLAAVLKASKQIKKEKQILPLILSVDSCCPILI